MPSTETVCTSLFNTLRLNQDPTLIQSENFSIEHQRIFLRGELEDFTYRYYPYRKIMLSYLNVFLRSGDQPSFYNANRVLITTFKQKPLVTALKEILSPVGPVSELMNIVSLCLLFKMAIRRIKHNRNNPPRTVIDGLLTNWKLYKGREKRLSLLQSNLGNITIEMVEKPGKEEEFPNEPGFIRYSGSSLQRTLALQLIKDRRKEKAASQDILLLRIWWFRDGKNRKGWYELLKKLKTVHLIQSKKFKDERLKRQRFISRMMQRLKGSFEERLARTTLEVNNRFPRNKPYSPLTIRREFMRYESL